MSREQLLAATYDAAEALNALKLRYDRIDKVRGHAVAHRIKRARQIKAQLDAVEHTEAADPAVLRVL